MSETKQATICFIISCYSEEIGFHIIWTPSYNRKNAKHDLTIPR